LEKRLTLVCIFNLGLRKPLRNDLGSGGATDGAEDEAGAESEAT